MHTSTPPLSGRTLLLALLTLLAGLSKIQAQNKSETPQQQAMKLLKKNIMPAGLNLGDLDNYFVTDAYADKRSGSFIVYLQQGHLGIPVYNKIGVYVFKKDTLISKRTNIIAGIAEKAPSTVTTGIDADHAIQAAATHLAIPITVTPRRIATDVSKKRYTYAATEGISRNITSDLVWLPMNKEKEIKLAWNVRLATSDGTQDYYVRVDAQTGAYLDKNSLIVSDRADGYVHGDAGMPAAGAVAGIAAAGGMTTTVGTMAAAEGGMTGAAGAKAAASVAVSKPSIIGQKAAAMPATAATPQGATTFFAPPSATTASYRVYAFPLESGVYGPRTVDTDPWLKAGAGNNATSLGWHYDNTTSYLYTRGNNVWAQQDLAGNNSTNGFADTSVTGFPGLSFDRAEDSLTSLTAYSNIRAGIDNLFYWNNLMHDISYQYGFDEASGNFQAANLGRGGLGNDYVHAFAQDGAGNNNANFATGTDGEAPVMRMYQFDVGVTPVVSVNTPSGVIIDSVAESAFGFKNKLVNVGPVTKDIVYVVDAGGTHLGCGSLSNSVAGKIALVDRGSCSFAIKVKNLQNAGAAGVIVVNNAAGAPFTMTGTDTTITIPAVMVTVTEGVTLKAIVTPLNGTMAATGYQRDGALDNGVISHEYTHGISTRLTGGPANPGCLFNYEQMGEGWSDYVSMMVTTNWGAALPTDGPKKRPLGNYAYSQDATGGGIRKYSYSTDMAINPWTYAMLKDSTQGGEPHSVGEIWCATIWDMTWNIIQTEGISPDIYHGTKGNNIALQIVIQAMKLQPCSPGFIDARDAILRADSILYGYKHKCAIWNAFARRGMGVSALQGSSDDYTDQVAAFDLPSGLGIAQTVDKTNPANGENVTYTIKATCDCSIRSGITIADTLSNNLSYVSASSGGVYTAPAVKFTGLSFAAGETKTFTVTATVNGAYTHPDTLINDTRDPANYTWTSSAIGSIFWNESTTRAHSGTHSYFAYDYGTQGVAYLTSDNLVLDTISTLSFWHYFETQAGYDGGFIEISTNGGTTWQDLGPYITQNGYNGTLYPYGTEASIANHGAWTGSSGGAFIKSVVTLTGFAGKTAKIRFSFGQNNGGWLDGWYIDDVVFQNQRGVVSMASALSGTTILSRSNTATSFAPGPLPVNFLRFEARQQGSTAVLTWKVNGEINVDKYLVERSGDGSSFIAIGQVTGSAPTGTDKDYSFVDAAPLSGNNYYRIVEKDLDGQSTISPIKLLSFTATGLVIRLAPVPTYTSTVQLDIQGSGDGPVSGYLINGAGQTVKGYTLKQGTNVVGLDGLAKGIYYLKVYVNGQAVELKKVVIQ